MAIGTSSDRANPVRARPDSGERNHRTSALRGDAFVGGRVPRFTAGIFLKAMRNLSQRRRGGKEQTTRSLGKSGGMPVAQTRPMTDSLHDRVRGEYREMPGLRLTVAQAARLFNLELQQCGTILETLVTHGALWTDGREYFGPNSGRRTA
jgi:hypothetical protein